ncbi:MAG TPA: M20/M25/M40 family metallo-hydrolase, partial [Bacillota bacterium]|nr:M20/M25/M40 family metallo-hydrolase [Bacillota bacterium]
ELPSQVSESAVATIGKLKVSPNGVNVIPGEVQLYVDIRDIYERTRDELIDRIVAASETIANKHDVTVQHVENTRVKPIPIDEENQQLLAETLKEFAIEPLYLPSGAGHDAMVLGLKMPVAMLFVRSQAGISHHPDEWTSLADCVIGVRVLKTYLEKLQDK